MDQDELSLDDLLEMMRRNLATVRSSWTAAEIASARIVARIAAEQFAERIRTY